MPSTRKLIPRAVFAVFCAVAIPTACGTESDARDAGVQDAGSLDAGARDAGAKDAGAVDAGASDTGPQDTGVPADTGPRRVVSLAAGSAGHACVALSDGTVWCWGLNDNGQTGRAPSESASRCRVPNSTPPGSLSCDPRPVMVQGLTGVTEVTVGNGTSCAVKSDRSVWCWGLNDGAQLGQGMGDTVPHGAPVRVDLPPVRHVSLGTFHACAVLMDGSVRCWGSNRFSQGGTASASTTTTCDDGDGNRLPCLTRPTAVAGLSNVTAVDLGRFHSCAVVGERSPTLRCWGLNDSAQLGNGQVEAASVTHASPMAVAVTEVARVSAGGSHNLVVRADGSMWGWGWGELGQLGGVPTTQCTGPSGAFQCARSPAAAAGLTGVREVSAGRYHSCALRTDGSVRCFGRGDNGQIGAAATERCNIPPENFPCVRTPALVEGLNAEAVSVGDYHSCAITREGAVRCWGWNAWGQLGDGTQTDRTGPVLVLNLP